MIPKITRGARMAGLMVYLASTDADKTKNAPTEPHLVAGDAAIMAWYDDGVLDRDDALAIAKHLDRPRKTFGVSVRIKDLQWDAARKERVHVGDKDANVWHCSLNVRAEEGPLTDQQWGDIANDFVDAMGFTEASGKARCRWAAINHGTSENGNHHIHIAVSLVREDGTKASTHGDYKRAQKTCRELEVKYGLEQLSTVHATRGYERAEKATAIRDDREMHRASLARKVRAGAGASVTEAEFVRRARDTGLLVRPRFAKNTTDVIAGYSVAERPKPGERPIWFGGGSMQLLAAARTEELRAQAGKLVPAMERHHVPVEYLANPELAQALQRAHNAKTPTAVAAADTEIKERLFLIGKDGVHGPDIDKLRKETTNTVNGAGDSHFKDPAFVKAARQMHEAKLLAEGGFTGSQSASMEQRYERTEKELFKLLEGVGREIENRVTCNDSNRRKDQGLKTGTTAAADYGSAERQEAFAASLATTGANESQIRGRAAAERSEGAPTLAPPSPRATAQPKPERPAQGRQ